MAAKTRMVSIRLREQEFAQIKAQAQSADVPMSELLRSRLSVGTIHATPLALAAAMPEPLEVYHIDELGEHDPLRVRRTESLAK